MKLAILALLGIGLLGPATLRTESIEFATLSDFDYKEGEPLPDTVTELHGKSIRISGFMRSEDDSAEENVPCFILVNDACGCEGTPKLNEMIFCTMPDGETTKMKPNVATVTGRLYVGEMKEDGVVIALYTMEVEKVE